MNARDRIRLITSHQEADRVPFHLNATKWVVEKLKKALQVDTDIELLKALNIDFYDMRGIDLHSGVVPKYVGPDNEFFPKDWGGGIFSFWKMEEFETKNHSRVDLGYCLSTTE